MRNDVAFLSQGLHCAGWLYLPDDLKRDERRPAIVMAHGFSAVKEMYLDAFAERFVAAGFVTLVFDYRFQGASEGEPRGQIIPAEQHEDYRNAITWVSLRPEVTPLALASGVPPTVEGMCSIWPRLTGASKQQWLRFR